MSATALLVEAAPAVIGSISSVPTGIFDTFNNLTSEARTAFAGIAGLVVVVVFFVIASKTRFAVAAVVMGIVMGALVFWAINGGLEDISGLVGEEISNAHASIPTPSA